MKRLHTLPYLQILQCLFYTDEYLHRQYVQFDNISTILSLYRYMETILQGNAKTDYKQMAQKIECQPNNIACNMFT
jgi:hypothetical protein